MNKLTKAMEKGCKRWIESWKDGTCKPPEPAAPAQPAAPDKTAEKK